jgi:hypothetical protein
VERVVSLVNHLDEATHIDELMQALTAV